MASLSFVLDQASLFTKLHSKRFRSPPPQIEFEFESSGFIVKTAKTFKELESALKLRYEVFVREEIGSSIPIGLDIDQFDLNCDHLIVIEKTTQKTVGTYRIIPGKDQNYYSLQEFHLPKEVFNQPGLLELGRACIQRDFRTGLVMQLLWRGLSHYIRECKNTVLIGCTSVMTMDPERIAKIQRFLINAGKTIESLHIYPQTAYHPFTHKMDLQAELLKLPEEPSLIRLQRELLPPLMLAYLRLGARFCLTPAIDKSFKCVDFFTLIRLDEVSENHIKRFGLNIS